MMRSTSILIGVCGLSIGVIFGLFFPKSAPPDTSPIGPLAPQKEAAAVELPPEVTMRVEVDLDPSPPSPELARVLEQIGGDHEVLTFDWMPDITKAQYLAAMVGNDPAFGTVREALFGMLTPARATEVYACMQNDVAIGRLPEDYLTRPITEKATLWDPIAKRYMEEQFLADLGTDPMGARDYFQGKIEKSIWLGIGRRTFFQSSKLFPKGEVISESDKAAFNEILDRYERPLRDLIRAEEFFAAYIEAIDTEVVTGQYEALPNGVNANYLDSCRQDKGRRRVINLQWGTSGWNGCLIVYEGEYPKYDKLLNEVEALRLARDTELENYILALR